MLSPCLPQQQGVSLPSQFDEGDMWIYYKPHKEKLSLCTIHKKEQLFRHFVTSSTQQCGP